MKFWEFPFGVEVEAPDTAIEELEASGTVMISTCLGYGVVVGRIFKANATPVEGRGCGR
jgi:hypothetical protein